ncbi:gliding motility-associated protein GldE [Aureivirga marina]|uniref:gliding motility-associated protein GldE n=1 Tax=Aureivirga marina TaxID=1182451 RepID=UPI0018C984E6|nr:gliding motility-associated protein GldE [Aureivirga marina]
MDSGPASIITLFFNFDWIAFIDLIALLLLLILSALVSGAEVAFFSLSREDLDEAGNSNSTQQKLVVKLLEKPKKLLGTILIFNNFINILIVLLLSFISSVIFAGEETTFTILSWKISFKTIFDIVIATFLILLFGEVLPKVYANRNSLKFATMMAIPLNYLNWILHFVTSILLAITKIIEKGLQKNKSDISVERLSEALELTSNNATTEDEQRILEGIVTFGNTDTSQIMTPRIDICAISDEDSFENVVDNITKNGFSRNPVYHENIDEIVGVLYAKDLIPHLHKKQFDWKTLLRTPYFVPENKKLDDLLSDFQEMKNHLAIVVDEYGGTSGIISLEDVIEEIVGDITDEFDNDDLSYSKLDSNNYVFEGKITLKDFYKVIEIDDTPFEEAKGEAESLAGFILEVSGRFPKKNEKINFENYTFTIESVDRTRIKQIKVTIKNEKNTTE